MLISCRSLAEYRAMFTLTENDLRQRILDCPGGASGFTTEVSYEFQRGARHMLACIRS